MSSAATTEARVSVEAIFFLKRIVGAEGSNRLLWANQWRCWCPNFGKAVPMAELLNAGLVEPWLTTPEGAIYYRPTPLAGELFGVTIPKKEDVA